MSLVQGAMREKTLTDSQVVWSPCDDIPEGNFMIDDQLTYADPAAVRKGIDVTLHLGGYATQPMEVTSTTITAVWEGTQLYKADFPNDQQLNEFEQFSTELSWPIPFFAPSGAFNCKVVINGKAPGQNEGPVACRNAKFTL